jgi:hypothetical protein
MKRVVSTPFPLGLVASTRKQARFQIPPWGPRSLRKLAACFRECAASNRKRAPYGLSSCLERSLLGTLVTVAPAGFVSL